MICKVCNNGDLIEDSQGHETNLVCVSCGSIDQDSSSFNSQIVAESDPVGRGNATGLALLESKYRFNCQIAGASFSQRCTKYHASIQRACEQITNNHQTISESAIEIFDSLARKLTLNKKNRFKKQFAASCLYIALQQHNVMVTLDCVGKAMQTPMLGIVKMVAMLKKEVNFQPPQIENVMETSISSLNSMKNRPELVSKAMKVVHLFEKMDVISGRSREGIGYLAAYVATISNEKHLPRCTKPSEFCKLNEIKVFKKDMMSFRQRLFLLVKRLPWITASQVRITQYHCYIDDLLTHADALFALPPDEAPESGGCVTSAASREFPAHDCMLRLEKDLDENRMTESEYLGVPASYAKRRKVEDERPPPKTYPTASLSETLDENDLPDSELCEYLRSNDEVDSVLKIQSLIAKDS